MRPEKSRDMRIGIVGGGIRGLACAHYVLKAGHLPVVLEAAPDLHGHDRHLVHEGVALDRKPYTIADTDSALCGLMGDLGALGRLAWKETRRGVVANGRVYPLESAGDLLRFDPVRLDQRLRAGLVNLYLTRIRRYGLDLDEVPAWSWLRRLFGRDFFERVWAPLLRAHFAGDAEEAPAYWAWRMLNRHMRGHREVRGHIRGGARWLCDLLHSSIETRGGEVLLQTPVTGIHADEKGARVRMDGVEQRFDAVISTVALPLLRELASDDLRAWVPDSGPEHREITRVVLVLRSPLDRYYATDIIDDALPFRRIVETTHVVPSSCTGGSHLVYVLHRSSPESPALPVADDVVKKEVIAGLKVAYPGFDPGDIVQAHVVREAYADPVWTVGSMQRRPGIRIGRTRAYLCARDQAYPRPPSWDTSVALSREAAAKVTSDLD